MGDAENVPVPPQRSADVRIAAEPRASPRLQPRSVQAQTTTVTGATREGTRAAADAVTPPVGHPSAGDAITTSHQTPWATGLGAAMTSANADGGVARPRAHTTATAPPKRPSKPPQVNFSTIYQCSHSTLVMLSWRARSEHARIHKLQQSLLTGSFC